MTSCGQEHLPVLCGHVNIVLFFLGGWGGGKVISVRGGAGTREF